MNTNDGKSEVRVDPFLQLVKLESAVLELVESVKSLDRRVNALNERLKNVEGGVLR